jgi:hypothetical protein
VLPASKLNRETIMLNEMTMSCAIESSSSGVPRTGLNELFSACAQDIEDTYHRLGHTLGWRFLTGPKATLAPATEIAFISLNPGGAEESVHQSGASHEDGSSYVTERWQNALPGLSPLQRQVQSLCAELMHHLHETGSVNHFLAQHVLTAHFIPFRSPSFATLANPQASLAFARSLWSRILQTWCPRLILTIDRETYSNLQQILIRNLKGTLTECREFSTGWGQYKADGSRIMGLRGDGPVLLVRLPHLSRFALFAEPGYSEQRKAHLAPLFEWIAGQDGGQIQGI